jgi:membrane carboxypeptidase/penicillin-binding protein PbpC
MNLKKLIVAALLTAALVSPVALPQTARADAPPAEAGAARYRLTIKNASRYNCHVWVDGQFIGTARPGQQATLTAPGGGHTIKVARVGGSSSTVNVNLTGNRRLTIYNGTTTTLPG